MEIRAIIGLGQLGSGVGASEVVSQMLVEHPGPGEGWVSSAQDTLIWCSLRDVSALTYVKISKNKRKPFQNPYDNSATRVPCSVFLFRDYSTAEYLLKDSPLSKCMILFFMA